MSILHGIVCCYVSAGPVCTTQPCKRTSLSWLCLADRITLCHIIPCYCFHKVLSRVKNEGERSLCREPAACHGRRASNTRNITAARAINSLSSSLSFTACFFSLPSVAVHIILTWYTMRWPHFTAEQPLPLTNPLPRAPDPGFSRVGVALGPKAPSSSHRPPTPALPGFVPLSSLFHMGLL